MTSSAVHSSNRTRRRSSAVAIRVIRATVAASSASVNAVSSSYRSRSTSLTLRDGGVWHETATAGRGADLAAVVHDLPASQHRSRPTRDLPALVRVVVAGGMHLARVDRALLDRIEEHEVGVLVDGD